MYYSHKYINLSGGNKLMAKTFHYVKKKFLQNYIYFFEYKNLTEKVAIL